MLRGIIVFVFAFVLLSNYGYCQELKAVGDEQKSAMIAKINSEVAKVHSMQSNFVQTKTMSIMKEEFISKGQLFFDGNNKLRWEYLEPYTYIFVLNGDSVVIKSANKKNSIDINNNRLFQEITRIMMNSITGKCLQDSKEFEVTMYAGNDVWVAELVPQKSEMKRMFNSIKLYFNSSQCMVNSIDMYEKNGDVTSIKLVDIVKNKEIDETVFSVD